MRKTYKYIFSVFIFSLAIFMFITPEKAVSAKEKSSVLFISSNSPSFISFSDQYNGIVAGFGNDVELLVEYMDFKTFDSEEFEMNFYQMLKYKLNNYKNIDAIILGDDGALEFAMKYWEDLFKDTPMVFFGVSRKLNIESSKKFHNITGIAEIDSIGANIELINKLHNNYKNILMITDAENYCAELVDEFYSYSSKYRGFNFSHVYSANMDLKEFQEFLNNIDNETVILHTYANNYKDKGYQTVDNVVDIITRNTSAPIYSTLSYGIGEGYVGGLAISHYEQGKRAAEIVKRILQGEKSDNLYMLDDSTNEYIFDYEKLSQFNINKYLLPKESRILNEPLLRREENRNLVYSVSLAFVGMVSVIAALILFVINDIDYTKKILKAKDLAESASNAKSNFISNISHELRTPVAVIMSSNQLLKFKCKEGALSLNKDYEENLKVVNQNCYRLLRLINNIIDVARVDSGHLELKSKNVNVIDLLEKIVLSVVPYAESKGIEIIFDTTDEELIMAVDSEKIERIVLNLISNAIKFTDYNGTINANVIVKEKEVFFSVEDTGVGIDEKHLNKIFNKFVQVDNTFMRKNEGSGIGLSIVKSFVELHCGEIFAESKIQQGSKFTIKLPIRVKEDDDDFMAICENDESNTVLRTKVEFSDIYL